jgi:hypothetical protein
MEDPYYFSMNLCNDTTLCIAPLSNRKIEESGQAVGDTSGYFLYETNRTDGMPNVRIIARLLSEDAACELSQRLGMI